MNLSRQTIQTVKATAPLLAEHGEIIAQHFYRQLFNQHPELLNIFNVTNQKTGRQQAALASAVWAYAAHIDNLDALTGAVKRIAWKHASLTILPEHYPVVGKHLLAAITHVLGDAATDDTLSAWQDAYDFLAALFINIEEGIYRNREQTEGCWQGTREFRMVRKVQESSLITSFYFEPVDGLSVAGYQPGQYISIYLHPKDSAFRCIRQYSLSDAPNGQRYRISVKREGEGEMRGVVSHYLHDHVEAGAVVKLSPPGGDFCLNQRTDSPVILLSGGVGQTPMLSILNSLVKNNDERTIVFVHGAINSKVHAFNQHVRTVAEQNANIEQILFYDKPTKTCSGHHYTGSTNLAVIRDQIDLPGAHYYFCGPLGYMTMVKTSLQSWGVPEDRLHYETFGPHQDI